MSSRRAIHAAKKVFTHYFPQHKWKGRTISIGFITEPRTSVCEPEMYDILISCYPQRHNITVTDYNDLFTYYVTLCEKVEGMPFMMYQVFESGVIYGGNTLEELDTRVNFNVV